MNAILAILNTIKNVFNSYWTVRLMLNPMRWRMVFRAPAFNNHDVEVYTVVGPVTLKIDLDPFNVA